MKEYALGDIVAIQIKADRAISAKITTRSADGEGIAESYLGSKIRFTPEQVLWVLGKNGKWPGWVQKLFHGDDEEGTGGEPQ